MEVPVGVIVRSNEPRNDPTKKVDPCLTFFPNVLIIQQNSLIPVAKPRILIPSAQMVDRKTLATFQNI
jgi:hypothetical protein